MSMTGKQKIDAIQDSAYEPIDQLDCAALMKDVPLMLPEGMFAGSGG